MKAFKVCKVSYLQNILCRHQQVKKVTSPTTGDPSKSYKRTDLNTTKNQWVTRSGLCTGDALTVVFWKKQWENIAKSSCAKLIIHKKTE